MRHSEPHQPQVQVVVDGEAPAAARAHARARIEALTRLVSAPLLHAHVRLTRHRDPAVAQPVVASANLDVNGRAVHAQVRATTVTEAIDLLSARLAHAMRRLARDPRAILPAQRTEPGRLHLARRSTTSGAPQTVDQASVAMDLLDHDFRLFTEAGTGQDAVLYRGGPTGYRVALLAPNEVGCAAGTTEVTVSPATAPVLSVVAAIARFDQDGRPFLFFRDAAGGRGAVLYRRRAGDLGLVELAPPA